MLLVLDISIELDGKVVWKQQVLDLETNMQLNQQIVLRCPSPDATVKVQIADKNIFFYCSLTVFFG